MRNLTPNHLNSLKHCTVYETLQIEMASGTVLRFAVGEIVINDEIHLGKLTLTSPLRMTLERAADNFSCEIDNTTLELGQALISQPNAFDNSFAIFGAYFKNNQTGESWHDEKLPGETRIVTIDGEKIICTFLSELDAAKGEGRLVSEVFPNAQLQREVVVPVDSGGVFSGGDFGGGNERQINQRIAVLTDDMSFGRYQLPDISLY